MTDLLKNTADTALNSPDLKRKDEGERIPGQEMVLGIIKLAIDAYPTQVDPSSREKSNIEAKKKGDYLSFER